MLCPACFPNGSTKDLIADKEKEGTRKKRDWRLLFRFACPTTKMYGRGRSCWKREWKFNWSSRDRRRTNERTIDGSLDRKKITTNRFYSFLSLSLSLSIPIFRNEPMSKWWYYWLIRLGSELRNRRGMEEREIHAIVSTQSYLASSLHRNSVSRPETSILFSISRKSVEKRQEEGEEKEGVSACSV